MTFPFNARAPSFDADAINATIQQALASAGLNTTTGPMHDVTQTIRRALASGRPAGAAPKFDNKSVIDVAARIIPPGPDTNAQQLPGRFEAHQFSNGAGSRAYKVYVPAQTSHSPRAMIVMLHGCTQSADDFAAGTQMNRLAHQHNLLVVYPEQAANANASKCWNWFNPQDQLRGAGEPSLIAGITSEVAHRHAVDQRRIFVAGMSAGAAMAMVLGETYPELFAGVGTHSGLPYGSAHDIASALAAMKGARSATPPRKAAQALPVIVFHGDQDQTVQHTNSARIVQQALDAHGAQPGYAGLRVSTQSGVTPAGRRFSCTVYTDTTGQARIESWTLHGAGHAWSGGHASGSYTDSSGPDASAQMLRFFLSLLPASLVDS